MINELICFLIGLSVGVIVMSFLIPRIVYETVSSVSVTIIEQEYDEND